MWQKQLKQLKKQTVEKNIKVEKTKTAVKTPEISFGEYCNQQKIAPLKQDTIILKPATPPAPIPPKTALKSIDQDFDLFDESQAKAEFFRFGQRNLPKELRLGKYKINAVLDLHNYTKAHAIALLEKFLSNQAPGVCLKIIHGQGLHSQFNQPVLQGTIRYYLQHLPQILAYSYGAPNQGGNGVTLVKLMS